MSLDLTQRHENMEGMLIRHDKLLHPEFDPDITLVAIRLPESRGTVHEQASALLFNGMGDHTPIVRARRLHGCEHQLGIVKIELPTQDDQIRVLRKQSNLIGKEPYENTYLRSMWSGFRSGFRRPICVSWWIRSLRCPAVPSLVMDV